MLNRARAAFSQVFDRTSAVVVRSPGRINLIGDHTDYTGGLVLPMAIDMSTLVAGARRSDGDVHVYSDELSERVVIAVDVIAGTAVGSSDVSGLAPWSRYVAGVAALLRNAGVEIPGVDVWIGSNLPLGGGLSSSAALEVGVGLAMLAITGAEMSPVELAELCRRAENDYAGSPCGIMDQLCCTSAQAGHALLIDCTTLQTRHIPLELADACIVVLDTGVRHSIAGREYANRRTECAEGLARLRRTDPSIQSLRDVDRQRFDRYAEELGEFLTPRIRHVVSENDRVRRASVSLESGDVATFGKLMLESHASLRDDFNVSCEELDAVVEIARSVDGVYGARMTGGGFGGCAVALVVEDAVPELEQHLRVLYDPGHDRPVKLRITRSADAARVVHRD